MTDSTSGVFPIGDPDCAIGHHHGVPVTVSPRPTFIPGTGDLWTTTGDLIRLNRALFGGRLLRREHLQAMTSALVPLPGPAVVGDDRIVATGCGYGTWIGTVGGEPAVICPGDNVGYRSLLAHISNSETDIAILTNDDGPTLTEPLDLALAPDKPTRDK